jgi:hypothetical protein
MNVFNEIPIRAEEALLWHAGVTSMVDALGRLQRKSPLFDMPYHRDRGPTHIRGEVELMDVFALGPYTAPFLLYARLLWRMILAGISTWRIRQRGNRL